MANEVKAAKMSESELAIKGAHLFGPSLESKFDEFKYELLHKIEKELVDSNTARDFITQKYDKLCTKIQSLTKLHSTMSEFRSDVKAIEKHISELSMRVDVIEKRAITNTCPSLTSSIF